MCSRQHAAAAGGRPARGTGIRSAGSGRLRQTVAHTASRPFRYNTDMVSVESPEYSRVVNLRRLLLVRLIVLTGLALAALYAMNVLHLDLHIEWVVAVFFVMALFTLATGLRLRRAMHVYEIELFGHLLVDVLALAVLLYLSGGATNPFVTLFLIPLALASAALRPSYVWTIAFAAVLAYTILLNFHVPLPHGDAHGFGLHVFGMWIGFVLSAVLIAMFAGRISATLRERDRLVSAIRERALEEERILALGTLAAGAAHELGTPLSTLAIIAGELRPEQPLTEKRADQLRTQIDRCRTILGSLTAAAGEARAEGGSVQKLDDWLDATVCAWRESRPDAQARVRWSGTEPAPRIVADRTLTQAIVNILHNAADASPEAIELSGSWSSDTLVLEIADRGSGIDPNIQRHVGEPGVSTKSQGLGLGLFLAYATLSRLGGDVQLVNREGGGVCCRLELPLDNLVVPE